MSTQIKFLLGVLAALAVAILAYVDPALAQEAAAEAAPAAEPAKPVIDTGDTAWMLTSTALVLMMTIPGLALFYGGMVRKKNVLTVVMQCFTVTCIVTVLWMVVGYSWAFTDGGGMQKYLGGMSQFMLQGMTLDSTNALAATIPESVFMTFQMTFAIITPASGFVGPGGALWIGAAAGVGCFFAATTIKRAIGYDDSLDVFGVHCIGGIIGAILTGVFAVEAIGGFKGALEGNVGQVWTQIEGVAATLVWSALATFVILVVVNILTGVRVSQAVEVEGLDINLHGEVVP